MGRRNFDAIEIGRHLLHVGAAADPVPRPEHQPEMGNASRKPRHIPPTGPGSGAVYNIITARTKAAFGDVVNPHLFRDCAATTIAVPQLGEIGVARNLLGRALLCTTNAHYNQARSIEASWLHAEMVAYLRADASSCWRGGTRSRRDPGDTRRLTRYRPRQYENGPRLFVHHLFQIASGDAAWLPPSLATH